MLLVLVVLGMVIHVGRAGIRDFSRDGEGVRVAKGFVAVVNRARERAVALQRYSGVVVPTVGEGAFGRYAIVDFELENPGGGAGGELRLCELERGSEWMVLPGRWLLHALPGEEAFTSAPVIARVRESGLEGGMVSAAVLVFGPDGRLVYPADDSMRNVRFIEGRMVGSVLELTEGMELEILPLLRVHAVSGKLEGNF